MFIVMIIIIIPLSGSAASHSSAPSHFPLACHFPFLSSAACHLFSSCPFFYPFCDAEGGKESPTDDPDGDDTAESADTVDHNVLFRRTASRNEGLVVFVPGGESDTDQSGDQHKWKSAQAIHVERNGNGDRQTEVFGHLRKFPHRLFDACGKVTDLFFIQSHAERIISNLNNLITNSKA